MNIKKNSNYIFYLDRQKLIIAGTQLAAPITLDFPANIVFDIDIIDPESFDLLLVNFLEQSKISPADIILVVSPDVYYEKNITISLDPTERQNQIDIFLQSIPFKNLIYKDYLLGGQPRLVTLNKNFYEPIVKFFEKNSFNVIAILPFFVLDNFHLGFISYLPKEVKDIYQKYKPLEPFSLITPQAIDKLVTTTIHRPHEDNSRALILLIVFCVLFVVLLGYLFIVPRFYKPIPVKVTTNPSSLITPTPELINSEPVESAPTINYISSDTLRIKVVNSSGISNQASEIKQSLVTAGFVQIKTLSSSLVTSPKNQITFSSQISPDARQKIREAVTSVAGISTEIELADITDFDVLITTTFKPSPQTTP